MKTLDSEFQRIKHLADHHLPYHLVGKVVGNQGLAYKVFLKNASIGSCVEFVCDDHMTTLGEVVGLKGDYCYVMPYNELSNVNSNTKVYLRENVTHICISDEMIGRVVDFNGKPIDGKGDIDQTLASKKYIYQNPLNPLEREPISESLSTGIKAIDCFNTVGKGQRIAIMAVQEWGSLFSWE